MLFILNCGSQSIKWKLFDRGLKLVKAGKRDVFNAENYQKILEEELKLVEKNYKDKIKKIGHRVVNGGRNLIKPVKINEDIVKEIEKNNYIAPLHNPFNVLGIKTSQQIFFKVDQFAVFDTEFFSHISEKAYTYALPKKIREKYGFKKMGFHGISHEYAAKEGVKTIKKQYKKTKIITCHLGGGSSIAAVKNGRAIDTSMGFSPMEGLVMMTRSGSLDPQIILDLSKDFSHDNLANILNKESGIKGLCGQKEMLAVLKNARKGDKSAKLALEIYAYNIKKCIGSYFACLNGCDLLVFTGTIGFGSSKIRNMVCRGMDMIKNTKTITIKPDEELAIAQKIK